MVNGEEQIWLKQLERGEDSAYEKLFQVFYSRLGMFAVKFVGIQEVAEDLVQEVLYDLWLRKLYFENLLALKTYLYNMVRNRCLDVLKHRKVEEKYVLEQQDKETSEFFLQELVEEEVYTLLKEAIAVLPSQTARVYELTLDGFDNAEIASIMHLTLEAVKSHKKRGKKILQERLKGLICFFLLRVLSRGKEE